MNKDSWKTVQLGDCFEFIRNGANIKQYANAIGIPITRIETLSNNKFNRNKLGYADIFDLEKHKKYLLEDGDILMSHINSTKYLGRAVLYSKLENETIIHGMNLLNLRAIKSIVKPRYIAYYFNSSKFKDQVAKITKKAVNQASFTVSGLREFPTLVAPLNIQKQIVKELDTLSDIIAKKKEQLAELDKLAQATFYDMFGDPLKNEKDWCIKKIGAFSSVGTGATPNRQKEDIYFGGNIPWVKTTEVCGLEIKKTEEYITEQALKDTNCKLFPINTILLAMYGQGKTRGQVGLLKIEATTNQACAAIFPEKEVNYKFLYLYLKLNYQYIRNLGRGGNQENLNLSLVKSIPVIIPPVFLQTQFAEKIQTIEQQKALINQSIADVQLLFDYTMDKYFN